MTDFDYKVIKYLLIMLAIVFIIGVSVSCNSLTSEAATNPKSDYVGSFAKVRYEFVEIDGMACIAWKSVLANTRGLTCNWDEWKGETR